MTSLSESRLRGLAKELSSSGPILDGKWFFGYGIGWKKPEWLQETWDGAGLILGEMGRKSVPVQDKFAAALLGDYPEEALLEGIVAIVLISLTPARIAHAAADALGVLE